MIAFMASISPCHSEKNEYVVTKYYGGEAVSREFPTGSDD
jgi:hypothetical protein